jgi:nucleoside kinase
VKLFKALQKLPEADFDLVCVGQTSIDTLETESGTWEGLPGGPALYVAVIASSLGLRTALVSRVGTDFDTKILDQARALGVNVNGVHMLRGNSTRIRLVYRGSALQRISVSEGVNSDLLLSDIPREFYRTKIAHLSPAPFAALVQTAEAFKKQASVVAFDPHADFNHIAFSKTAKILRNIDFFFSNVLEAQLLSKHKSLELAAERIRRAGPRIIVTTQGSAGAIISFNDSSIRVDAIRPERIVNYVGAGDAFQAGFLFGFLRGYSPASCGVLGAASAACILAGTGMENLPSPAKIQALLKQSGTEVSVPIEERS